MLLHKQQLIQNIIETQFCPIMFILDGMSYTSCVKRIIQVFEYRIFVFNHAVFIWYFAVLR